MAPDPLAQPLAAAELAQIALAALVLGTLGTALMRKVARRFQPADQVRSAAAIDPSRAGLVLSTTPSGRTVALLGGLAIAGAVALALAPFVEQFRWRPWPGLFSAAALMAAVGLVDDWRPLKPGVKALAQLVATLVLIAAGTQIHLFRSEVLNVGFTVLWVLGITNAINLLDNVDGLAAGVVGIACAVIGVLAYAQGLSPLGATAAALLGASAGFLLHNFHPARIYMGDTGSQFSGFLLAALAIELRFPGNTPSVTWMVPVLIFGLPIFDTSLVVYSRLRRRVPIWTAGRDHVSHRLVAKGWSVSGAVLVLYAATATLCLLAMYVARAPLATAYILGAGVLSASLLAGWWLEHANSSARGTNGSLL